MSDYVQQMAVALKNIPSERIACHIADSAELVAIMLAAHVSGKSLLVFNREYGEGQIGPVLLELNVDLLLADGPLDLPFDCLQLRLADFTRNLEPNDAGSIDAPQGDSEILILTSGTTGTPKCARYLWSDLLDQVGEHPPGPNERWLLAYKLNHFAGVQMLAHVIANSSSLVLAQSGRVADSVNAMTEFAVTHVSSTPTFWRFALTQFNQTQHLPTLRQITLGSEPVSAELLDELAHLFPAARIVHIYALTEAGSCISVSDGKAGLPASILARPADAAVQFKIFEDELQVKTAHGMRQYLNPGQGEPQDAQGWLSTGDLVRVERDRIYFVGRRSETINVGGVKVHPLEVENVVSVVPGVQLARVYGRENPIMGQIVAVELVLVAGHASLAVEDAVREACLVLPRHSRPRSVDIVDTIATSNFKLVRRGATPK
jgi:acyl-CoA synthetase (AMP-forming)/AMP-acid ligase II